jgi:uncharacterized phage-like protein YoqJ
LRAGFFLITESFCATAFRAWFLVVAAMKYITQTTEAHDVSVNERYEAELPEFYNRKIACFTGHRNIPNLTEQINNAIDKAVEMGINHFFVGMALGSDQLAAKVLVDRKLSWSAIIPCANQSALWSQRQKKYYDRLLRYAENQVILSPNYTADCMHVRNRYMIDHSDVCIAVYDGRLTGGTANTYRMAISQRSTIIKINPKSLTVQVSKPRQPAKQMEIKLW